MAFSTLLVLWVLAIPALIWALYQQGAQAVAERRSFKKIAIRRFISVLLFCVLIGGLFYLAEHMHWRKSDSNAANVASKAVGAHKATPGNVDEPTFKWPVAAALGGILVLASTIPLTQVQRRRRRRRAAEQRRAQHEQLAASIEVIVDDLLDEPDSRRAVIAAYARMETLFAQAGEARRENETQREYLRRVVVRMTGQPEAVERLTMLFERAKFSGSDVTFLMKRNAIAMLRQIRDDLLSHRPMQRTYNDPKMSATGDATAKLSCASVRE